MYFQIAIYSLLHERSNASATFAEYIKCQELMTVTHSLWMNSGKSKWKKLELRQYTFWNCYI